MTTAQDKIDKVITDMAEEIRPIVQEIEQSIATSQNHYGEYMSVLSQLGDKPGYKRVIAAALVEAGANRKGVRDALAAHGINI